MRNWKRLGYVSIELVITASLIMAVGFFLLLNLGTTGSQIMQNGMAKLEDLGIFDGSTNTPVYDKNGYPVDSNIDTGDINPIEDFTFELNMDGDGYILVSYNNKTDYDVVIPNEYLGLPVMAIGASAFNTDFTGTPLNNVVMPNTIEMIDEFAFYGNQIQTVIVPGSVDAIRWGAFSVGTLNHVTFLGARPSELGIDVFADNTGLQTRTVLVPDNHYISYKSVAASNLGVPTNAVYCLNMPIVVDTVNPEEDFVFQWEDNLNGWAIVHYNNYGDLDVIIPSQLSDGIPVVAINASAFANYGLTSVTIPSSVKTIKASAFTNNALTNVMIPDSVTLMEEGAFSRNQLTSVTLSNGLSYLARSVLENNQINTINIPNNITTIEESAFKNSGLTSVEFSEGLLSIQRFAFYDNNISSINLPDSLVVVGEYAFSKNDIIDLVIPNNVTEIKGGAFSSNNIESITFGNGLLYIQKVAFQYNNLSGTLIFPDSLISIGMAAFVESGLQEVVFGTGLKKLGSGAFAGSAIRDITFKSNPDVFNPGVFGGNDNLTAGSVRVPMAYLSEFQLNQDSWGFDLDYFVGY